jgi:hypothetical protein
MALDSSARLYVLGYQGSSSPGALAVFAPHSTRAVRTISNGILSEPSAIALSGV